MYRKIYMGDHYPPKSVLPSAMGLEERPDARLLEYTCSDTLWDEYLSERGLILPDVDSFPVFEGVEP